MKKLAVLILLMIATSVFAAGLREGQNGPIQGPAPDPLQSYLITDNLSHTIATTGKLYFNFINQGTATAYVRIMNTTTKASHPQYQVESGMSFGRIINKNALYINYSSASNNLLEIM